MFAIVSVGTNNLEKAAEFYDAFFAELGVKRISTSDRSVGWGNAGEPKFSVLKPLDGQPATVGNGCQVTLAMESPEQVQRLHQLALSMGGTNEGDPGPRGDDQAYHCGYFRDLDGNKFNLYCPAELA